VLGKEINKKEKNRMKSKPIKPPVGTIVKIEMSGNRFNAFDKDGNKWTHSIITSTRKSTYKANMALECREGKGGRIYWWKVPIEKFESISHIPETPSDVEIPDGHAEILEFISDSYKLKPKGLIIKELKWKYLIRSAVRGKNIMMTGQAGCGKTMAAKALVKALDRPEYYFNLGATQDPRSTLIVLVVESPQEHQ
jgi:Cdc6-like AAA superfamily ATPase